MLNIHLADTNHDIKFQDYPGDNPVKFILNLKKIFPSVMDLLLPILPEDNNLEEMAWESTTKNFEIFKNFLSGWGVVELRLTALTKFKDRTHADNLVKLSQKKRQEISQKNPKLSQVELDYLFLQTLHSYIDADLVEVGEAFYLPTLRQIWKPYVSPEILNGQS